MALSLGSKSHPKLYKSILTIGFLILLATGFYDLGLLKIPEAGTSPDFNIGEFLFENQKQPIDEVVIYSGRTNEVHLICLQGEERIIYETSSFHLERIRFQKPCFGPILVNLSSPKPASIHEIAFISQRQLVFPSRVCLDEVCSDRSPFQEISEEMQRATLHSRTLASSMAFDEVFNASIAHHIWAGLKLNENWLAHPLLGRAVLGIGIKLFGSTPFGWRVVSAVFGVLVPVLVFFVAYELFGKLSLATLAYLICVFDPLRTSLARLSTTDLQIAFFTLIVVFCLKKYLDIKSSEDGKNLAPSVSTNRVKKGRLTWLVLAGISAGLAANVKLSGAFILLGALPLVLRHGASQQGLRRSFREGLLISTCMIVTFFTVHYSLYTGSTSLVDQWLNLTNKGQGIIGKQLWTRYDTPSSSKVWQWVLGLGGFDYKSTSGETLGGFRLSPLITLSGFASALYGLLHCRQPKILLLGASYFSSFVPFFFISRPLYCYHYFTANTLGILLTAAALIQVKDRYPIPSMAFIFAIIGYYAKVFPEIMGMEVLGKM